jgi:hypothetical protein
VQGFGWWESFVNWEPEAEIGGSKSAGRAIPGWTDLECLLGLLLYIYSIVVSTGGLGIA